MLHSRSRGWPPLTIAGTSGMLFSVAVHLVIGPSSSLASVLAADEQVHRAKAHDYLIRREAQTSLTRRNLERSLERDCITSWDGVKPLGHDGDFQCWRQNISRLPSTTRHCRHCGDEPRMCLRRYSEEISDELKKEHKRRDCELLSLMWEALPDKSRALTHSSFLPCDWWDRKEGPRRLFVDVGADIGACLLPMAMRQDVEGAVAIEPYPKNLFYLTSGILMNPQLQNKTIVYPYAAGQRSWKQEPLYEAAGDAAGVVVGRPLKLQDHDTAQKAGTVTEQRLDDIFGSKGKHFPYIHVLKLDAQGYEVKILQGARELLKAGAINAVKFGIATHWLRNQGSEPAELLNIFVQHHYQIFDKLCYDKVSCPFVSDQTLHDAACGPPISEDFVAIRLDNDEKQYQHAVKC
mmetsp:Transcript_73775/g.139351  ORF Transcript_73775/g.139351 Transcript_73775/m.139351 type:complete len:406 (-) Transcript_73775:193-1410(-)